VRGSGAGGKIGVCIETPEILKSTHFNFKKSGLSVMRTAILSDIHANLEALRVVLEAVQGMGADRIYSLGDLVGYNADPNACVDLIREREIPSLMGNHDVVACGTSEPVEFNPIARAAALWTREILTGGNRGFLEALPEQRSPAEGVRLVHGSLLHRDHYLLSRYDIMENVNRMRKEEPALRILFFEHTPNQVAFACDRDNNLSVISAPRFALQEDRIYLINPGSVGQPRDQDPRSAFLLYDEQEQTVEFIRLSYDIKACAKKILSQGLPRELADRLDHGW